MHLHFLGIGGTFMGSLALLARALGHTVTGSDRNVYPPMSTQLREQGIEVQEGYAPAHLDSVPDLVVIGNALSRGNDAVEAVLERRLPYISGPQWLHDQVLPGRRVLAVAGTHGKTTTASLLAWILEFNQCQPGFLIGGIPLNFGISASLGNTPWFVIEADEYDTAFFDKRSKFVHYSPEVVILNNLEFDHADIFPDIDSIRRQFHHLVRIVPGNGRIIYNAGDANLGQVLDLGCWSPCETFGPAGGASGHWQAESLSDDAGRFAVLHHDRVVAEVGWDLVGGHNMLNAVAAIAAAGVAGIPARTACEALASFRSVKRRLQRIAVVEGITVYEDFAHHPTAIRLTLEALRGAQRENGRILVAFVPRSNSMRLGAHRETLAHAFAAADQTLVRTDAATADQAGFDLNRDPVRFGFFATTEALLEKISITARTGDTIVIMSNGSFDGLAQQLPAQLERISVKSTT